MISKKGVGDFLERSESPDGYKKAPHNGGDLIYFEVVKYSENMGKY